MIEGVKFTKLKIISDHRGSVLPMIRSDTNVFESLVKFIFLQFLIVQSKHGIYIKKQF